MYIKIYIFLKNIENFFIYKKLKKSSVSIKKQL